MFPVTRPRRLRLNQSVRSMVKETTLGVNDFILPFFVVPGSGIKKEISSLPGQYHLSVDMLEEEVNECVNLGLNSFMFFGVPEYKDAEGSSCWKDDGIIQKAARALKKSFPKQTLIADVCFCEYTDHGHCGVLKTCRAGHEDVDNDQTLINLQKQVISLANAGIDMMAPSGNIDGMVRAIRSGLDDNGYSDIPIMSYAVKYFSAFYGPFRDAVQSAPSFGDRQTYQMDPANTREAVKEALLDVEEGADILMVKPALSYLDIIYKVKEATNLPLAAYNVSGEYSMIKLAGKAGIIDEERIMLETLTSMKRAGADIIITYFAKDVAKLLKR